MDAINAPYIEQSTHHLEERGNPLLREEGLIPFDQIQPHHFKPAVEAIAREVETKLQQLEMITAPSWEAIVDPLEELEENYLRVVRTISHLLLVTDSCEIRLAWSEVEPLITQLNLRLRQSQPLYDALETIKEGEEWETLSPTQKRIIEQRLAEAKLKGIELEGDELERFNMAIYTLNELHTTYVANMRDASRSFFYVVDNYQMVEGLPYSILKLTSESYNLTRDEEAPLSTAQEGPWKLSLARPIYSAVIRHCHSREVREKLYTAQVKKASSGTVDNSKNIQQQLQLRKEIAKLLGFASYADMSFSTKMASSVEAVKAFLEELRAASWAAGREDLSEVEHFAARTGFHESLMPWDFSYWAERLKEERFHLSAKELKPYFQFPKVLEGLFDLCHKLFSIEIVAADFKAAVWHPDVNYFLIRDEEGAEIGSFYLDPYSRESKRGGAWTGTCQNRVWIEGELQRPIAYIICNATPPSQNVPALLSFQEVVTLFHEFGHALQHVLTKIDYASVSGSNGIEWDAVELPSKFMENWCYHKPTLREITEHYQTGEPLPEVLLDKIIASRTFHAGSAMLLQLKYSLCDLVLHHDFNPTSAISPFEVWHEVCLATSHLPCMEEDRFLCSFHHIFGGNEYAAAYYSYKWAEVLSADAYHLFEELESDDWVQLRELGEKFKSTFLELGGSMHPMQVFELFQQRPPSIDALLQQMGLTSSSPSQIGRAI
ncbi:MAG: Oligopeptidase A [Chlamydiae bacterium]|nr:Oligopeptidase A [Chlamydiota bacterium]